MVRAMTKASTSSCLCGSNSGSETAYKLKIRRLKIEHLRNIASTQLNPLSHCNIISGKNGAGKTSLLEAIYLLARAKSFRSGQRKSPIQAGHEKAIIYSELVDSSNSTHKLGLSKSATETRVRFDGTSIHKLSDLASTLPISLITPNSHRLIEDGPDQRRRLLNWGVFHVEHEYKTTASQFHRTLQQRNNALRSSSPDLSVWNETFVRHALSLHRMQSDYFKLWREELYKYTSSVTYLNSLQVSLSKGWSEKMDLTESIKLRHESDRTRGFTSVGPHRTDIAFRIDGQQTKHTLSRGQQKVLITCVLKAQSDVIENISGKKTVMLYDDIDSELDEDSLSYVIDMLLKGDNQIFATSINKEKFEHLAQVGDSGMFHVEHGAVC